MIATTLAIAVALATLQNASLIDDGEERVTISRLSGDTIGVGGEVYVGDGTSESARPTLTSISGGSDTSSPDWAVQPTTQVGTDALGRPCLQAVFDTPAEVAVLEEGGRGFVSRLPEPFCPEPAAGAASAPALPAPEEVALRFWEQVQLPAPEPRIAPGYAVTGKTAYLETGARPSATYERATPLGTLTIRASAELWVDWGEGQGLQGPYATLGGPWPDGDITHVYADDGTVDVTVTQQWTATWALAGATGTLGGLSTTAAIPDFTIRQLQPVLQ